MLKFSVRPWRVIDAGAVDATARIASALLLDLPESLFGGWALDEDSSRGLYVYEFRLVHAVADECDNTAVLGLD